MKKNEYANPNTIEYIDKINNLKEEIFLEFIDNIVDNFGSDDMNEKSKSLRRLIMQYKTNENIRMGIDLSFIALTGYSIGTLLEQTLEKE